jgi:hypothetical protein
MSILTFKHIFMDLHKYGPFANVVAIAGALIATFSVLLLKMIGRVKQWTWISSDSPSLIVTVGARMLAIALMAITYITIDTSNYIGFAVGAIVFGFFGLFYINRFNHLRKLYVAPIPLVGADGSQLRDNKGAPLNRNVVIGLESNMNKIAKGAFNNARKNHPGLSLVTFMSGYGTPPNDPEAIWDRELLASLSNKLTMSLVYIALFGVMVLFLAAFVIEVFNRTN